MGPRPWHDLAVVRELPSHGGRMRYTSEDESGRRAQDLGDQTPHTLSDLLATVPRGVPSQASLTSRMSQISQMPPNVPHLRFRIASFSCLLPLDRLGGVLAERPQ